MSTSEKVSAPSAPIGNHIGICMSGGGYRASAFHLGTLDYLNKINLLNNIAAISSVSGGTFTASKYIISLTEKTNFRHFFEEYYTDLKEIDLLDKGLKDLAAQKNDVPSGRQDLIVSMAQVYSETFFCKKDKSPYYFDVVLNGTFSINDVMLNATDFRSGVAFRFQRSVGHNSKIGNKYNNISHADAANIRLADIVAASSCFPGGFEPLSFPYDFTWADGNVPDAVAAAFPKENSNVNPKNPQGPVPLMDGGVYDNQGLQSLLLADKRNKYNLDLVIISDVSQPSIELYEMPKMTPNGGISLGTLANLGLIFFFLCLATLATIATYVVHDFNNGLLTLNRVIFLYAIPFCLTAIAAFCVYYTRRIVREDVLPHIPMIGNRAWSSLKLLTTGQLRNMLKLRITSVLALTSSIFMKRIRALIFDMFYDKGPVDYNGKRVSNLIYSLSPAKTQTPPMKEVCSPTKKLNVVACVAFNQPTTLWFDKPYQEACLVASGQASICYNMIKLFAKKHGDQPDLYTGDVKVVWTTLLADWNAFNEDPFFLLAESIPVKSKELLLEISNFKCNWGLFE